MKLSTRSFASAAFALVLMVGAHDSLRAQVVETRESDSNPVVTVFRGTLYGAGTGLLLGGAYALIESDGADETRDILKWGVAGGAIAGAAVGLVYVLLRPQPRGDADVIGMVDASDDGLRFGAPTLLTRRVDMAGQAPSLAFEARLLQARF
jgi:hypothetical protein